MWTNWTLYIFIASHRYNCIASSYRLYLTCTNVKICLLLTCTGFGFVIIDLSWLTLGFWRCYFGLHKWGQTILRCQNSFRYFKLSIFRIIDWILTCTVTNTHLYVEKKKYIFNWRCYTLHSASETKVYSKKWEFHYLETSTRYFHPLLSYLYCLVKIKEN